MLRGTTIRTLRTALVAVLFTLPFFAPPPPFAAAYTARHFEAKAQPGVTRSGERIREGAESDAVVPSAAYDHMSRPSTAHNPALFEA
ncbi:hypothetical protein ACIHCM_11180 [Streptomyces sp. NPDC052023]|uniref:hypothetical protein n=1 Tax=Streptomyces sp. NPDC052023 TaxID=3365681 RepID=UPI0037CFAF38